MAHVYRAASFVGGSRLGAKIGMLVKFCDLMRSRSFEIEVCQVDLFRWTNEDLTRMLIVAIKLPKHQVISDNLSTNQNFLYVYFSNFKWVNAKDNSPKIQRLSKSSSFQFVNWNRSFLIFIFFPYFFIRLSFSCLQAFSLQFYLPSI